MKKILVILIALGSTFGVIAQPKISGGFRGSSIGGYRGGGHYVRPRVTVIAPVYPSYGYGLGMGYGLGYRYSPFYDPFYSQRLQSSRPSQLDLQIEEIDNDYDYKIETVKNDKSLSKDERKQKVRDLKHQKDNEIINAKKNYYGSKDESKERD